MGTPAAILSRRWGNRRGDRWRDWFRRGRGTGGTVKAAGNDDPLLKPGLAGIRGPLDHGLGHGLLLGPEAAEDKSHLIRPRGHRPTAKTKSMVALAKAGLDVAQTIVTTGTAIFPQTQAAHRQRDVIDHHQQLRRRDLIERAHRLSGLAAEVDVGEGFHQQTRPRRPAPFHHLGIPLLGRRGQVMPTGQGIDDGKPEVMAGAIVGRAGITDAKEDTHGAVILTT